MIITFIPSIFALVMVSFVYWFLFSRKKIFLELVAFSKNKLSKPEIALLYLGSAILFLSIWDIVSKMEPEGINKVPCPVEVLKAFISLIISGQLLYETWFSLSRILIGFTLASFVGIACGLLAGSYLFINHLIVPVNSFLRYIPPTAFISLLIVYFGIGETYKYAVIFLGVIFFYYPNDY